MPDLHRAPTTRDPTQDLRVFPTSPSPGPVAPEWGDCGRHGGMHGGVGASPPALPAVLVPSSPPKFVAVGIAAFGCSRERAHASACASAHSRVYARGDGGGVGAPPPTSPAVWVPLSYRAPVLRSVVLALSVSPSSRCCSPLVAATLARLDTRPPLDAATFASCDVRGASLAPCFSARSHASGRVGSTAARRRFAAARRSSRRRSRALLALARSATAFATARHSAAARRGDFRLLR